jgi:hypothetical protein
MYTRFTRVRNCVRPFRSGWRELYTRYFTFPPPR